MEVGLSFIRKDTQPLAINKLFDVGFLNASTPLLGDIYLS